MHGLRLWVLSRKWELRKVLLENEIEALANMTAVLQDD